MDNSVRRFCLPKLLRELSGGNKGKTTANGHPMKQYTPNIRRKRPKKPS